MTRTVSENGLRLILEFEGFVPHLYDDPSNATVAVGILVHLGKYHDPRGLCILCDRWPRYRERGMWLTKADGLRLLAETAKGYAAGVELGTTVPLSQNQFDALTSFCFNVGVGGYRASTVRGVLNAGHYDQVCAELRKYVRGVDGVKYLGLVRRREAECALFNTPDAKPPLGIEALEDDMAAIITAGAGSGNWFTNGLARRFCNGPKEREELARVLGISKEPQIVSKETLDALPEVG